MNQKSREMKPWVLLMSLSSFLSWFAQNSIGSISADESSAKGAQQAAKNCARHSVTSARWLAGPLYCKHVVQLFLQPSGWHSISVSTSLNFSLSIFPWQTGRKEALQTSNSNTSTSDGFRQVTWQWYLLPLTNICQNITTHNHSSSGLLGSNPVTSQAGHSQRNSVPLILVSGVRGLGCSSGQDLTRSPNPSMGKANKA